MKRISNKQSRRNIARRKRKVTARHAKAGHWDDRPRPMFNTGTVRYEVGATTDATNFGGIAAVHRLVTKLGLVKTIDAELELLKMHLPYHESDHVLNIAYNVLCGGTRLEDIERLRHDTAYMNALGADLIPDPTTAGDFARRFKTEEDVLTLMDCINSVRPQLWRGRGRELMGPVTYIDVDGTIAPTYGECKAGMDISYKGLWGYGPLIVSLANTNEVLYLVNRPANVPSHTDAARWIDKAIELVEPHAERVCVRGDTDFSLTKNFDRWAESVDFIFGMDCSQALRSRAEALEPARWELLERKPKYDTLTEQRRHRQDNEKQRIVKEREYHNLHLNYEDVAEFDYEPGNCQQPYRVVVLRKNISKMKGERVLLEDIRYFFYITTRTDLGAAEVVRCANQRCDQENIVEQLKNGVSAMNVPLYDLVSNWAYMVMTTLAWNIKSWFAMMMHQQSDRRLYVNMEFRRFVHSMILIPCRVVRRARSIVIRLIGYQPTLDRLFSAWNTIERTGFT